MRIIAISLLFGSVAAAQTPQPPAAQPPAPAQVAPATAAPAPKPAAETYTYDPAGRRDPFISLLGAGSEQPTTRHGEGAAQFNVAEISVRGIVQNRGSLVAMVQGPDNKTYIVRAGDKFADGTIKSVVPQGLVIIQEVTDPLSLVKQREIRKLLRSLEDAKE